MRISKLALGGTLVATILGGLMTFAVISGSPVGGTDIVHAAAPEAPTIQAFAICSDGSTSSIEVGNVKPVPRGGGTFAHATCFGTGLLQIMGGGYEILNDPRGVVIISLTRPLSTGNGVGSWVVKAER